MVDEVRDYKEIPRKLHLLYHLYLEFKPVPVNLLLVIREVHNGKPPLQSLPGLFLKIQVHIALPFREVIMRKVVLPELKLQVAPLSDLYGILYRLRTVIERLYHLLRGLDIELVGGKRHPVRVLHGLSCLYAEKHLMGLGVFPFKIMAVVCGYQRDVQLRRHLHKPFIGYSLLLYPILLYLKKEAPVREYGLELLCHKVRLFLLPPAQQVRHLTLKAG